MVTRTETFADGEHGYYIKHSYRELNKAMCLVKAVFLSLYFVETKFMSGISTQEIWGIPEIFL